MLFTGKIILERGEEVLDDGDAPGPPEQLLASPAADVGNVGVVEGEAEDPVHPREVAPEIASSVGSRDLDSVNHNRVTLQEPRDVPLVVDPHGHHVLKHPEEGALLARLGPGVVEQVVELEEKPPGPFCTGGSGSAGWRPAAAPQGRLRRGRGGRRLGMAAAPRASQ